MSEDFPLVWRVRTRLAERFGRRCRVLVRGTLNSCLVEFEDGYRVVTSRWYVRKHRDAGGGGRDLHRSAARGPGQG